MTFMPGAAKGQVTLMMRDMDDIVIKIQGAMLSKGTNIKYSQVVRAAVQYAIDHGFEKSLLNGKIDYKIK